MFKMNASTVAVTDYKILNDVLAKVILSFTGKQDAHSIRAAIAQKFDGLAAVVEHSFKIVKPGVAVGFLRANVEVRSVEPAELAASYRIMSSNIVMSNEDRSLWSMQDGKAGKFLTRQQQEDLSALVEAGVHRTPGIPGLRHLTMARAAKSELVAYVNSEGDMDYGFAVANVGTDKVRLLSYSARVARTIDYDSVVSIVPVQVDAELKSKLSAALTPKEKSDANAYWTKLYSFAPDYMREVIRQVNEDTTA